MEPYNPGKIIKNMKMGLVQTLIILVLCHGTVKLISGQQSPDQEGGTQESLNFYSFPVMDILDNLISLEEFKGKVSLVVNVASRCGYTDGHYRKLNLLQQTFEDTGIFNVLAFPCNQFGGQEPGSHQEIYRFAYETMHANFRLFAKVDIINQDINPAWQYLIESSGQTPTWNFWKYLVDHNGRVLNAWGPSITPDQLYPFVKKAVDKAIQAAEAEREKRKRGKKKRSKDSDHSRQRKDEF